MKIHQYSSFHKHNTLKFLSAISQKLSGRKGCQNVEYRVIISATHVWLIPDKYCFPDKFHRKSADKLRVVNWALLACNCKIDELIPGEYVYKLSVSRRKRRWMKEETNEFNSFVDVSKIDNF